MAPAVDEKKRHPRSPAHSENTSADGHYRGLRSECYDALLIGRRSGCLCHVGGPAAVEIAEPEVVSDLGTTPGEETTATLPPLPSSTSWTSSHPSRPTRVVRDGLNVVIRHHRAGAMQAERVGEILRDEQFDDFRSPPQRA